MNFHVASRGGSPLTLTFQQGGGGGGSCLNCSNKMIKKKKSSLASLARVLLIHLIFS